MKKKKIIAANNKHDNPDKLPMKSLNSKEENQTASETSCRLIYIADESNNLTYVNKAMCGALGYNRQELLQMKLHQIFSKESYGNIKMQEQTEFLEKGEINRRVYFITKDGGEISGDLKISPIFNSEKELIGSRAIFHDLSDRIKYGSILQESRERYQTLVENLPAGIGIISEDGKIVSANNLALGILGYELKDLEWLTTSHFYSNPDDKDDLIHKIATDKSVRNYKIELKRKDGSPVSLILNIKPIVRSDGNYFLVVFNDVTERNKTDKIPGPIKETGLRNDKLKSEFLAKICCEVRIDAIIIRDLNETISDKLMDKIDFKTRSYLNEIESSGSRILRMMDLFHDMAGIKKNDKKRIDLNYILQKSYLKYKLIAEAKDIDIKIIVNANKTTVAADEYITAQIFSSIIENAVKYTTRSNVEIVMEETDNKLCVSFSNTGIGMSNPSKFFSLFSREKEVHLRDCNESDLVFPFLKIYCDLNGAIIYAGNEKDIESKFTIAFIS